MSADSKSISIMDTTLRDGEQTPDISYTPSEKLQLARMLLADANVDRIEIASTRVSEGEREAAKRITSWARKNDAILRVEMLGFCDGTKSVDWLTSAGGKVLNLLTKGSERHCLGQLRVKPAVHREQIAETIRYAKKHRVKVNVYLEDWSNGVRENFDYVASIVQLLREHDIERIYLPDTLGAMGPEDTGRYIGLMVTAWPDQHFEYHSHNDYGLSTANCLAAVRAGARGVHTSVNGLGERAGNTRLAEIVPAIKDLTEFHTLADEKYLATLSKLVETFTGKEVPANAPIVGQDVFTQTAGVHADGDAKGDLYASKLLPTRFQRQRRYALGKLSGKASIDHNLKRLGIELAPDTRKLLLRRIIELGDKKHTVGPEDLPLIIAELLKMPEDQNIRIQHYDVTVAKDAVPAAQVRVAYQGRTAESTGTGDGGYDAFMNALRDAMRSEFEIELPKLADYRVRIAPGGRTEALVETLIRWVSPKEGEDTFATIGVDSDQMAAAVIATEKMLNASLPPQADRKSAKKTSKKKASRKAAGAS